MRFFLDNCISPKIARALDVLEEPRHEIIALRAKFHSSTPDPEWLRALGDEGDWIVVSGDPRISRSKAERKAWYESGLTAFFFASGYARLRIWPQVQFVIRWWGDIVMEARDCEPGSGFSVPQSGAIRQIYDPTDLPP